MSFIYKYNYYTEYNDKDFLSEQYSNCITEFIFKFKIFTVEERCYVGILRYIVLFLETLLIHTTVEVLPIGVLKIVINPKTKVLLVKIKINVRMMAVKWLTIREKQSGIHFLKSHYISYGI